jgi:hypothetical protein
MVSGATVASLLEANRIVKRAKDHAGLSLKYSSFPLEGAGLICVSDASFANMAGGKSQSGTLILLGDRDLAQGRVGRFALLDWRSGRQKRACRSTFGAEALALSDTADRGDFMRGLLYEALNGGDPRKSEDHGLPLRWVVDAKDLFDTLTRAGSHSTTEYRLALETGILRELLSRHDCSIHWIGADQMMADCLTKDMPPDYLISRLLDCKWSLTDHPEVAKKRQAVARQAKTVERIAAAAHTVDRLAGLQRFKSQTSRTKEKLLSV